MMDSDKIAIIRGIMGDDIDDLSDAVIGFYLDSAKDAILRRLYPLDPSASSRMLPSRYENRQIMIAADLIQRRGAEGETAHSESGVNRTYSNAYVPKELLKDIVPFAHIPGVDNSENV